MKLPRTVKVACRVYSVIPMTKAEMDECSAMGVINHRTCTIKIDTDQNWQIQVETLWHEVKHAIHSIADLTDESKEEDYCSRAAPIELMVLLENKALMDCIMKGITDSSCEHH